MCLVLFAFILQINSIINGVLYLIFYKEEKLCLFVAGSSAGIAGRISPVCTLKETVN